jgi:hypothetical protein
LGGERWYVVGSVGFGLDFLGVKNEAKADVADGLFGLVGVSTGVALAGVVGSSPSEN